jgi:RecA-family ATPase
MAVSKEQALRIIREQLSESSAPVGKETEPTLEVLSLKDIRMKPIAWLWKFWIALGKTTVLAGNGGEGKSTILCDWIARATNGDVWPDGAERSAPCSVLVLAAEDDVEDTLKPRLAGVGADMDRIFIIRAVRVGDDRRSFNLQTDLARLEEEITRRKVRLVIIDPISSYLGKVDSHKNAEVRSVLEPLGEMAARLGVAIVCNNHFSKGGGNANSRIIGSVAFVNQARAAFIVTPDAENEGRRLLMPSKMNIAPIKHGLAYRIEGCLVKDEDGQEILTSRVAWEMEPVTITADQALAAHEEDGGDRSAAAEAEEFLRDRLSAGPVAAREGEEHARALGIATKTLKRARKRLGVIAEKDGLKGGWTWRLPPEGGQEPPKRATSETWLPLAQDGPLRGKGSLLTADDEAFLTDRGLG